MPYLSRVRRKEFSIEIRKICFLQNSLELHQPNMHIDDKVIPISVHILSLARISWILTHCFATVLLLQVTQLTSEIFVKVSSLQPTCYCLWHMLRMRTP